MKLAREKTSMPRTPRLAATCTTLNTRERDGGKLMCVCAGYQFNSDFICFVPAFHVVLFPIIHHSTVCAFWYGLSVRLKYFSEIVLLLASCAAFNAFGNFSLSLSPSALMLLKTTEEWAVC